MSHQALYEAKFPYGTKVRHRSFGREGYVVGYAAQRGRVLLLVDVVTTGELPAWTPNVAEWSANTVQLLAEADPSTVLRLKVRHSKGFPVGFLDHAPIPTIVPPPKAQVNHAAKKAKPDMDLLMQFPKAMAALVQVLGWAEQEKGYGFQEFMKLEPKELRAALLRHTFQSGKDGEARDDESKQLHAVHALSNALMYVESLLA